jgi:hypothetical protein
MTPERTKVIDDTKIEEFYWAGKMVVYVNNQLTPGSFDQVCNRLDLEYGQRLLDEADMPGGFN